MSNRYSTREQVKARLTLAASNTSKDALIDAALDAVSREIELVTHRWFYPLQKTNYYTPSQRGATTPFYASSLMVDDLLSVTALQTDQDGDLVYETVWTPGTDYTLAPYNAAQGELPEPYWEIQVLPYGHYRFPVWPRSVQVTGAFGFYDVRAPSAATVQGGGINASATTLTVSDGTLLQTGHTLFIDTEQLFVSAIAGNALTVTRGVNGTTAAAHAVAAAIQIAGYPVVAEACLFQVGLDLMASAAVGGMRGGGAFAQEVEGAAGASPGGIGLHPFARRMLGPLTLDAFA